MYNYDPNSSFLLDTNGMQIACWDSETRYFELKLLFLFEAKRCCSRKVGGSLLIGWKVAMDDCSSKTKSFFFCAKAAF